MLGHNKFDSSCMSFSNNTHDTVGNRKVNRRKCRFTWGDYLWFSSRGGGERYKYHFFRLATNPLTVASRLASVEYTYNDNNYSFLEEIIKQSNLYSTRQSCNRSKKLLWHMIFSVDKICPVQVWMHLLKWLKNIVLDPGEYIR